ncbi:carnitine O-acetyltransferase-like [Plectropomus leopardus]|uniref:carnitine O-acetyltransferase-like n=1 Tax=Plectropomus leopardus TaxID=160734 RepID=UPI001C4C4A4C|nr:carnitine O-acetyltransferase-like [Plectropomus leopardus]
MLRICSRTLVGMVKPYHLVRPVSVTLVASRNLSHQKDLPSQPVPPLQQTCDIYLQNIETILEGDEVKRAKKLVEEFRKEGGVGERLQRSLERKAENSENWSTEAFVKADFLITRRPIVGLSNPSIFLPQVDYRGKKGQIRFAAKYIASAMEIKTMVDNNTLPAEHLKGQPLCMKQYEQLFSSCRIPGLQLDTMEYYTNKHITVAHSGQFFKLEVYNSDGSPLTVDQLCVQLERICSASLENTMEPVGILTTQRRDVWHKVYNNLIKDKTNKESVLAIQSSIFTVCLDGAMLPASGDESCKSACAHFLHGGGSQWNSANRWFDKGMQLLIGEDGAYGINFSNAVADGVVHINMCEHFEASMKKPEVMGTPMEPLPVPQKLHFNITPEIKKDIEEAKQHMDTLAQELDLSFTEFDHFGKDAIKTLKMRPNAFFQMALQLAHYRMFQRISTSLESVSQRMFKQGRIVLMNTNSADSAAFVKAFDDPKIQNREKVDLLEKASKAHAWYTDMAFKGQSIHNHLLGLQWQAVEEKIPMPGIFKDASFHKVFDYKLAASSVFNKSGCVPCFGPEEHGQFDVLYSMKTDNIELTVASLKSSKNHKEKNSTHFAQALEGALLDMRTLVEQTKTS